MEKISKKLRKNKGMTLVELMVVLGIFIIVTTLTIFDYGKFRSTISLQNLADDVALSVRTVQNYSIGVRRTTVWPFYLNLSNFDSGYGIRFSTAPLNPADRAIGSEQTFIIFTDIEPNKTYDHGGSWCGVPSATHECIDIISINSGDKVSAICPYTGGLSDTCLTSNAYADISFLRPNPDASICIGTIGSSCTRYSAVDIVVKNTQSGDTRTINVSSVGQISIR